MPDFHDVRLPDEVEKGVSGGPNFKTTVIESVSGYEQRNINWSAARGRWDISYGILDKDDFDEVQAFFWARRGKAHAFRFKDWSDFEAVDENIGTGNGTDADFQLTKTYEVLGPDPYVRTITRPVDGTLSVKINGVSTPNWVLEDFGALRFLTSTGLLINDAFTKVLLPNLGTDGSTTITDIAAGGSAHTWTAAGNAQIDTGNPHFPDGALLCDGTGDYVFMADSADIALGSGPFDIEGEFEIASGDGGGGVQRLLCGQLDSSATATSISFFIDRQASGNFLHCYVGNGAGAVHVTSTTAFSGNTNPGKHHFRLNRDGANVLRLFVDGVQEGGNVAAAFTVNNSTNQLAVGRAGELASQSWNGWIGKFCIAVGTTRATTNYPPPANGQAVTASFEFDVPVRFDSDAFDVALETATAGAVPTLPIVEIREGVNAMAVIEDIESVPWQPSLAGDSVAGAHTYSARAGWMLRHGNMVVLQWEITLSAKDGAMAGNVTITGFPYAAKNVAGVAWGAALGTFGGVDLDAGKSTLLGTLPPGLSRIYLLQAGDNVAVNVTSPSNITNTTRVNGSIVYERA